MSSSSPPPPAGEPYPAPGGATQSTDAAGFFRALFDFSFTEFITPKVVKFVYVLATIALVLGWLAFVVTGFAQSPLLGLFFLVIGALVVIVYLALIRMTLEFYLALVRMSEDVHRRLPGA